MPRGRTGRRIGALACALGCVLAGNVLRIAGSIAVGLVHGKASLVLFHDWVGSLFAFGYTLGGYLLMLFLLLPRDPAVVHREPRGRCGPGGRGTPCICLTGDHRGVRRAAAGRRGLLAAGAPGPDARPDRRALRDEDPQRRRAGVLVATEQGLRANAALLAAHLDRERDPAVLAALVDGVLRHRGSPPTSRRSWRCGSGRTSGGEPPSRRRSRSMRPCCRWPSAAAAPGSRRIDPRTRPGG